MPVHVLVLGDHRHHEFASAMVWLQQHAQVTHMADVDSAIRAVPQLSEQPQVVLLAQSRRGQFKAGDIECLHRATPLARLVALLGSWCEGEQRTGQPWPGVIRIYWHQWQARFGCEFASHADACGTSWNVPRTASDTERLLAGIQRPVPRRSGLIAVHAPNLITYGSLADACETAGYSTAWLAPRQPWRLDGITAAIWDAVGTEAVHLAELSRLASRIHPAPVLALLGFPRLEDQQNVRQAGAQGMMSKPFLLHDLLGQLEHLLPGANTRPTAA